MKRLSFFQLSLLFFLVSLFAFRYERKKPILPKEPQRVAVEGAVASLPYVKGESQYTSFRVREIVKAPVFLRLDEIQMRARIFPELKYGDVIRVEGVLSPYGTMRFPEIEVLSSEDRGLQIFLVGIRKKVEKAFGSALPQDEAGLLSGILLGSQGALSPSLEYDYKKAGLTHVVVASGYNMTVLLEFLLVITSPFGLLLSFVLSLLGLLGYASVLGWHPPVTRAFIMSSVGVFGLLIGRKKDVLRVLLISAGIMLFINPPILNSLSFQLSFAATFGLILLGDGLKQALINLFDRFKLLLLGEPGKEAGTWQGKVKFCSVIFCSYFFKIFDLGDNLSSTVAATLFIYPIVAHYFGKFSLVSFLANTFLLWATPVAMFFGLLAAFVLPLSRFVFKVLVWCAWPFLRAFNLGAGMFSAAPLLLEGELSVVGVVIYYAILFVLCITFLRFSGTKENRRV